jgi:tripartite-type tricarboxylate transporter receptor subunit TctC
MRFSHFAVSLLQLLLPIALATAVSGQPYPTRPITVTIPYAAGGTTDVTGRIATEYLSQNLGVPLIIENRVGGGPILGTTTVARAQPDGYHILYADSAPFVLVPNMKSDLPYDPWNDFVPIALLSNIPLIFIANPNAPFKTLPELINVAKQKPDTIKYGTGGTGTSQHVTGLLFENRAGIRLVHVPYRGGSLSTQDTVAGHIEMTITSPSSALQFIDKGLLVPFAVASDTRLPSMPAVPTFLEMGFKDFQALSWFGIFAPKGTPSDVIERLQQAALSLKNSEGFQKRLEGLGASPSILIGAELNKFLADDNNRLNPIIKSANIRLD